jgi:hypothetical protein
MFPLSLHHILLLCHYISILKLLTSFVAAGDLPKNILNMGDIKLITVLTMLVNFIFQNKHIPPILKSGIACPIYKKGGKQADTMFPLSLHHILLLCHYISILKLLTSFVAAGDFPKNNASCHFFLFVPLPLFNGYFTFVPLISFALISDIF